MKKNKSSSLLILLLMLVIVFVTFSTISVEARKHQTKKHKPHKHKKDKGDGSSPIAAPVPQPPSGSYPPQSNIFDVLSFGAKGDGVSDDSKVKQHGQRKITSMIIL